MVGQMHSRLGILRVNLANEHNVYSLKEDYQDIVKTILTPFSSKQYLFDFFPLGIVEKEINSVKY